VAVRKLSAQELIGKGYGDFWKSRERYRIVKGSRGSKKSKTAALNLIFRLVQFPLANALCVRRYGNTLRDSMFSDLKWAINKLRLDEYWECSVSPMQMTYKPTGQKILFRGLDDGMKITSISVEHGSLCFVWIEEAYEIREDDFNKLDMSIRGEVPKGYFKQLTLTFNPWSANSWLKKRFFDVQSDSIFTLTTTWECNEWLGEDDRKLFLEMKKNNPRRYLIEGRGEWGISEGLIYENVDFSEFDIDDLRRSGLRPAYGLDFGYTDPNAFVAMLVDNDRKIIYIFDEFYKTGITNRQIAAEIKQKGYGSERIICDCAEPKSITELRDEGIRAEPSRKGRDSVTHGIQLIQNYKIIVHPICVNVTKEISNYCWEKTKDGKLTERPDHEFSHGMDAMRYGVQKAIMPDAFSFD
jgi:phage terminase large subunit